MKLRDYKTLLTNERRTAMLFDLTERFPRGPDARLRDFDYKSADGVVLEEGWGSNTAPYLRVAKDGGSTKTGGWDPYAIFELPDSDYGCEHLLQELQVDEAMAMGDGAHWNSVKEGKKLLFKRGAQLTRRSRRMANRVRQAKKWIEENIGTAVYAINMGYYSRQQIYVHADSKEGAISQWELFMAGAFSDSCEGYDGSRGVSVQYVRPAKTPLELMQLNQPFLDAYREMVKRKRAKILELQQQIEAMDTAEQIVNIYAINMVASWGTGQEGAA